MNGRKWKLRFLGGIWDNRVCEVPFLNWSRPVHIGYLRKIGERIFAVQFGLQIESGHTCCSREWG